MINNNNSNNNKIMIIAKNMRQIIIQVKWV